MVDVAAPGAREAGHGALDLPLERRLVPVDERLLALAVQPYALAVGRGGGVLWAEPLRAQQGQDGAVHQERPELLHEVEGEAGTLVGGGVQHPERGLEPGSQQSSRALGQQDRVGVGEGSVGQVLGRTAAAAVEGDLRWDQPGQAAEVCR